MSSSCDPVLGHKVTPLVSHPRIVNVGSRAGAEIGGGDVQEGLEGFRLAVREERSGEVTAPVPAPLGQAAMAGGRFRHEGKLLPAEGDGLAGAYVAQPAREGCEDEAACTWRQGWL